MYADVTFDTTVDPVLPRDAIFVEASWTRLAFRSGADIDRTRVDAQGYVGLPGQAVFVIRALREDASGPLPSPFQSLLGGWSNLRGFRAGAAAGDTLAAGSAEVRLPLSSPLSVGRLGVSAFVDAGAAYPDQERLRDQTIRVGIGGGVWMSATAFRLGVAVARGRGASTRVHFGAGVGF
jgi:hemolysin activation/secretion protein